MDIFPHDLGRKRYLDLIEARGMAIQQGRRGGGGGFHGGASSSSVPPRLGPLGRLWTRGEVADPEVAAAGLGAMRGPIGGIMGGMIGGSTGMLMPALMMAIGGEPVGAAVMGAFGLAMASVGLVLPGVWFRRLHRKPLSRGEIEELLPHVRDELERAYLTLVLDALEQKASPEVEKELRTAVRALAEAIDRLPAASATAADTAALRREAGEVLGRAQAEVDAVIAASLLRRAEALGRRADAHDRSALLMRRSLALREELFAQTEALRAGLTAFHSGATDIAGLSDLAESVRAVANEATSVALAREELDAAATPPPRVAGAVTDEEQRLTLQKR